MFLFVFFFTFFPCCCCFVLFACLFYFILRKGLNCLILYPLLAWNLVCRAGWLLMWHQLLCFCLAGAGLIVENEHT